MESAEIKIYRQVGSSPNPSTDILLGTDTSLSGGVWSVNTTGWSEGRYTMYAVSFDVAGNESGFEMRKIGILPYPMQVSGLISWVIGEMDTTQIGSLGS